MKKILALLLFLSASALGGQALMPYYLTLQPYSGGTGTAAGTGYTTVEDEGVALAQRTTINFEGASIECVDAGGETVCTLTTAGSGTDMTGVDALVGTATGALDAEIVVGTSPGGELGGTWASPTIDDGISISNITLVTPALGTPSAAVLTNATGLPLGTGVATGSGTSAELAGILTNESGSGLALFGTSPTIFRPVLSADSSASGGLIIAEDTDGGSNVMTIQLTGTIAADRLLEIPAVSTDDRFVTGTSVISMTNKDLVEPTLSNGATSAGSLFFLEDSDNGAHSIQLVGVDSVTSNRILSLPSLGANDTITANAATQTLSAKTLTAPNIDNGATSAGYERYLEDSDNGTNYVQVNGVDSLAANMNVRLLDNSPVTTTIMLGPLNGEDQIYLHDEFACGNAALAAAVSTSCLNLRTSGSGGTFTPGFTGDATTIGAANCTIDATNDTCHVTSAVSASAGETMLAMDGFRFRARAKIATLNDGTDQSTVQIGSGNAVASDTAIAANGLFFSYSNATGANWFLNVADSGADTQTDTGIAATTNWTKFEIWYQAGVGVHFYIDGVETAGSPASESNIPTAAGEEFNWVNCKWAKTAGSTARTYQLDYATFGPTPVAR